MNQIKSLRSALIWIASIVCVAPATCLAEPDTVQAFYHQVEPILMAGRFADLEAMASRFRASDSRFPGGDQKLFHFYNGLGSVSGQACGCGGYESANSFEQKQPLMRKWLLTYPKSVAAHVVMARMLTNYAWLARGHGYASTVTVANERLYEDRLAQAEAYIHGLDPKEDPQVNGIDTSLARASNDPRARLDAIYARATARFPKWFMTYSNRADVLQPKWFGAPGELAAYSHSLLSSPGGDDGKIAYSYAAERLVGQYNWQEFFASTGMTWPAIKEAYAVREKRYGMNNSNWNNLLELAMIANDMPTAKIALRHIGSDWDSAIWVDKKYFDQAASWVNSH